MEEEKIDEKDINLEKSQSQVIPKRKHSGENFEAMIKQISRDFDDFEPLERLSTIFKLRPGHLIIIYFLASFFLVLIGIFREFITCFTGFFYPAYATLRFIENSNIKPQSNKFQWITYWIIYSLFFLVDYFICFSSLELGYYSLKLMFLIWLFYPKTEGALLIYNRFLRNIYKIVEDHMDNLMETPWG